MYMLSLLFCLQQLQLRDEVKHWWHNEGEQTQQGFLGPHSVRWVHILVLVLVEIVVEIVERLVTLVPVQVNGV